MVLVILNIFETELLQIVNWVDVSMCTYT